MATDKMSLKKAINIIELSADQIKNMEKKQFMHYYGKIAATKVLVAGKTKEALLPQARGQKRGGCLKKNSQLFTKQKKLLLTTFLLMLKLLIPNYIAQSHKDFL